MRNCALRKTDNLLWNLQSGSFHPPNWFGEQTIRLDIFVFEDLMLDLINSIPKQKSHEKRLFPAEIWERIFQYFKHTLIKICTPVNIYFIQVHSCVEIMKMWHLERSGASFHFYSSCGSTPHLESRVNFFCFQVIDFCWPLIQAIIAHSTGQSSTSTLKYIFSKLCQTTKPIL